MENQMSSKLILGNDLVEQIEMRVFPDYGDVDLVGFVFSYEGEDISLCGGPISGNGEEYFHLDKFNLGCLIDYLKRIYEDMDSDS